jgi:hypothetical protein
LQSKLSKKTIEKYILIIDLPKPRNASRLSKRFDLGTITCDILCIGGILDIFGLHSVVFIVSIPD